MLVLSRKIGEGIQIGDGIEVAILSVRNGRVRLGLAAPQVGVLQRVVVVEVHADDSAPDSAVTYALAVASGV